MMNNIFLIDKQPGITSFGTIREIKRILGVKKIGHSGTLDKFASGLLVVFTGWTTKLAKYFLESDKRYIGRIKLGIITDTDDPEGEIIEKKAVPRSMDPRIFTELKEKFTGRITQIPPRYSALKINGKRASDHVRKGTDVTLEPRYIHVYNLEITEIDLDNSSISIDVACSKGTYIRSLARDIGNYLGTGGYLEYLRRIESGGISVNNAVRVDELKACDFNNKGLKSFMLKPEQVFTENTAIVINDDAKGKVFNGAFFKKDDIISFNAGIKKPCIIFDKKKNLIAIADVDADNWSINYINVFNQAEL